VAGGARPIVRCTDDCGCTVDPDIGDGGPATAAVLTVPYGLAVTPDSGYVVSQLNANRVWRVSPDGTITTLAGTDLNGFSGDGGPATSAQLNVPMGVAVQPDGGVLIADSNNHHVRRISPEGTITTVAGNGTEGFSGDGDPATEARLDLPVAVTATDDSGFLIADYINNRVRRVSLSGTITTVAGNGGRLLPHVRPIHSTRRTGRASPNGGPLALTSGKRRPRRGSDVAMISIREPTPVPDLAGEGGPPGTRRSGSRRSCSPRPLRGKAAGKAAHSFLFSCAVAD
jgi:hypothetical protein